MYLMYLTVGRVSAFKRVAAARPSIREQSEPALRKRKYLLSYEWGHSYNLRYKLPKVPKH